MINRITLPLALATTAMLALGACSSNSSLDAGERMSNRGDAIAVRGSDWSSGQKDVRKGQDLIERANNKMRKAEDQIRSAQSDRAKGEQMIANGNSQMRQAESGYNDIRRDPSALDPR
jgi:septal ring factor EnvC (AmiA/AmiB activator)